MFYQISLNSIGAVLIEVDPIYTVIADDYTTNRIYSAQEITTHFSCPRPVNLAGATASGDKIVVLSSRPGEVKASIPIIFDNEYDSPFAARSAPEFSVYFNKIWKEIN